MTRARRSLRPPPADLSRFPRRTLFARATLWRIHRRERAALWFASDGAGRFDLPAPWGTCYAAEDPLGAFLEVFRDVAVVPEAEVAARALSALRPPGPLVLADLTSPRARAFGVTGEIHTTDDYALTQAWAAACQRAGMGGLRYLVRHDPSQRLPGVALFGRSGSARGWPVARSEAIGAPLLARARQRFGIAVLPIP